MNFTIESLLIVVHRRAIDNMASASFIIALSALASLVTFPSLRSYEAAPAKKPAGSASPIHGSQLIGAMVYDEKHAFIGAIEDVIFTLATPKVPAKARAILRVCDREKSTAKRTVIDFSKLKAGMGGTLTVSVSEGAKLRSVLSDQAA